MKIVTACRYRQKTDWTDVHQVSESYKNLFKHMNEEQLVASVDVKSYTELDYGFVQMLTVGC